MVALADDPGLVRSTRMVFDNCLQLLFYMIQRPLMASIGIRHAHEADIEAGKVATHFLKLAQGTNTSGLKHWSGFLESEVLESGLLNLKLQNLASPASTPV